MDGTKTDYKTAGTRRGRLVGANVFRALLLSAAAFAAGCESMGFDDNFMRDTFTPSADAETSVRTWNAKGKPEVREVPNDPAFQ